MGGQLFHAILIGAANDDPLHTRLLEGQNAAFYGVCVAHFFPGVKLALFPGFSCGNDQSSRHWQYLDGFMHVL